MTFSERLQALIDRNGSDQRDVAVAWHARWQKLGHKGWSPAHVESSLSRCAQGKAPGIRFFFEEAARGGLLLDMLGATEAEREELVAGAAEALGPMGTAPRLVVDFTPWSSREEPALFRAAEELFLTLGSLFPAAFVVTAEQYRLDAATSADLPASSSTTAHPTSAFSTVSMRSRSRWSVNVIGRSRPISVRFRRARAAGA